MSKKETKEAYTVRKKRSLLYQVAVLFLVGVVISGASGWYSLLRISRNVVEEQKKELASAMAEDLIQSIKEYPSWEWLLKYWYDNRDSLDVEYDAEYLTRTKAEEFNRDNPGYLLTDSEAGKLNKLPKDEQRKYAEIVYSWMILRMDAILSAYDADYMSIVSADPDYSSRTFLLSGADGTKKRGTGDDDAFVLGVTRECPPETREAMENAVLNGFYIKKSEGALSRYTNIKTIDNRHILIVASFDTEQLMKEARISAGQMVVNYLVQLLILVGLCLLLLYAVAIRPLEQIKQSIDMYTKTRDISEITFSLMGIMPRNEIGSLAESFSSMIREIENHIKEIKTITAENERIGAELSVATQIQADMLPRIFPAFPDRNEVDIYAIMRPAKEVGGDFYDYFFIDPDHLALVIADVSGKGVPASLFMVISKTIIKNRALLGGTPSEIISYVNDQLCQNNDEGMFVTVWFAIIEISTGKGVAVNAGHEHPALKRKDGKFELIKYAHSPMIAIREGVPVTEHEFTLYPGDTLFVYTDGVTEAADMNEDLFETGRLLNALNSMNDKPDDIRGLLNKVLEKIDRFVGLAPQFDDITMLGFRYYGPEGSASYTDAEKDEDKDSEVTAGKENDLDKA